MRAALKQAHMVYLATDPDREGEAIAWHLKESLGLSEPDYQRVTFDSITASAIQAALKQTRKIDMALVRAQKARPALDRLVGYRVSPVISDVLGMSLSAGRVQAVSGPDQHRCVFGFRVGESRVRLYGPPFHPCHGR